MVFLLIRFKHLLSGRESNDLGCLRRSCTIASRWRLCELLNDMDADAQTRYVDIWNLLFSNIWCNTKSFSPPSCSFLNYSFRVCCAEGAFHYSKCILFPLLFSNPGLWKERICFSPVGMNCQSLTMERMAFHLWQLTSENGIYPDNGMFNGNVYVQ